MRRYWFYVTNHSWHFHHILTSVVYLISLNRIIRLNWALAYFIHGITKYWEIDMTKCSTLRYVQKLLRTRSIEMKSIELSMRIQQKIHENFEHAKFKWRFVVTISFTLALLTSVEDVDGRPERGISSTTCRPLLNALYHS